MLVHDLLRLAARQTPDVTALIDAEQTISFGALDELANRFANIVRAHGLCRGDRVVLAIESSIELVAGYFGTMRAGGVAVPLPCGPRSDRLASAVADCRPTICVIEPTVVRDARVLRDVRAVFVHRRRPAHAAQDDSPVGEDLADMLRTAPKDDPTAHVIDQDLAAIIYTSGSTGTPRGVMLRHRNIVANTRSIVTYLNLTAADRVMCVLPLYYVYGLSLLHTHIMVGGSVVLDTQFVYPNVVLDAMARHRVTGFAGVPSTFALLLRHSSLQEMTLPDLRYVTQAGGGMPPAQILEWLDRGPKVQFFVMYGATEASARLTYLPPSELRRKLGSIGVPIPDTEVLVMRDDGQEAAADEVGELVARGNNIACGYWENSEETREKFGPHGYRTGDLGYRDADGFIFLVGRRHDMIKVGANRVGPKEIEDVLYEFPGVHEAAVFGFPHEILGEVPIAILSMRHGSASARPDQVRAFCGNRLPTYKIPAKVIFRSELPKIGGTGKIDRLALRELVGAQISRPNGRAASGDRQR